MARAPRVTRSALTAGSAFRPDAGHGWEALATLATVVEGVVRPKALRDAQEQGANAVYRDDTGNLRVDEASMLGGELAAAHNSAAFAAYLGQSRVDIRETLTELRTKHVYDPAAFREAADEYVKNAANNAPPALRADIRTSGAAETVAMFDGLRMQQIGRDNAKADKTSEIARAALAEDVVGLIQGGVSFDDPRVVAKMNEIASISAFRVNSAFIGETEAEADAFVKGVRGSGKVARFMRDIEDLGGVDAISDEDRKRLTAIVSDPDIDPATREKMYGVLNGTLKGVDARSFVRNLTSDGWWDTLRRNEKGGTKDGVPRDENGVPLSSASGNFGLLDGTFTGMIKKLRDEGKADWAKGMSDEEILKHKSDPAAERQAAEAYRTQLQGVLTANGLPINPGNEYVMWVLGDKGGIDALKADPSTPAADVVGQKAVDANKRLMSGKTIGEVIGTLRRKAGGPRSSDITGMREEVDAIPDAETRAMAQRELNSWYAMKRQAEAEAAEAYTRRIAAGEPVTRSEILNDPTLDDAGQAALVNSLRERDKVSNDLIQAISDLRDPNVYLDPNSVKDRNRVDNAYKFAISGNDPLSDQGQAAAAEIVARTGFVPKSFYGAIEQAMSSRDPARIALAMGVAEQVHRQYPGAFTPYGRGGKELGQNIAEFRHELRMGRGGADAAAAMAERRTPENLDKRRQRSGEAKKFADSMTGQDLVDGFDDQWPIVGLFQADPRALEKMLPGMMMMLRREAEEQFIETGDKGAAKARALAEVGRVFGPSSIAGGDNIIMRLPPEQVYPAINGSHDWIREQLVADVSKEAGGDVAAKDIQIVSDDETQADLNAGRPASYVYFYFKDGQLERGQGRFYADIGMAKAKLQADKESFDRKSDATKEFFGDVRETLPESSMEAATARVQAEREAEARAKAEEDAAAMEEVRRASPEILRRVMEE